MIKEKDILSFSDAYGLSLVASTLTGVDRAAIIHGLSPKARRIGNALIGKSTKKNQTSSKNATKTTNRASHR
jgi:hypothetical protein